MLHNVGKNGEIFEKCQKTGSTHVEAWNHFFFQDFFGESKIGHFFCPFFKKAESPGP